MVLATFLGAPLVVFVLLSIIAVVEQSQVARQ